MRIELLLPLLLLAGCYSVRAATLVPGPPASPASATRCSTVGGFVEAAPVSFVCAGTTGVREMRFDSVWDPTLSLLGALPGVESQSASCDAATRGTP